MGFAGPAVGPGHHQNRIISSGSKYGGRLRNGRQRSRYQLSPERGTLKATIALARAISSQKGAKSAVTYGESPLFHRPVALPKVEVLAAAIVMGDIDAEPLVADILVVDLGMVNFRRRADLGNAEPADCRDQRV